MSRTPEEQRAWDMQAMGCTQEALLGSIPPFMDPLMYAMCILSDAQEEAERGRKEVVRQFINRAKCILVEFRQRQKANAKAEYGE